jgi:hypothetical protein
MIRTCCGCHCYRPKQHDICELGLRVELGYSSGLGRWTYRPYRGQTCPKPKTAKAHMKLMQDLGVSPLPGDYRGSLLTSRPSAR